MKSPFRLFLFSLCLVAGLMGCEKELILPEGEANGVQMSGPGSQLPGNPCGNSRTGNLVDGQGHAVGTVEVMNTDGAIYLDVDLGSGYFLEQIKVYFGDVTGLPQRGGQIVMEDFQFQAIANGATDYVASYPLNNLPSCNDLVVWAQVSQKNMFGQTLSLLDSYLDGTSVYNGSYFEYCIQSCGNVSVVDAGSQIQ